MNDKKHASTPEQTTEHTDREGYRHAMQLLHRCATEHGFLAATTDLTNYRRVWSRDGAVLTLAALMSGEEDLIRAGRNTLETLADHQGPHGEIPSNVDPASHRISYGGTTGRVDGNLWFIITCGEYWARTGDDAFIERMIPVIESVRFLLGAWEFNTRGLLYVPQTGDWADEYVHNGYVLYDQLLYLQAQRTIALIHEKRNGGRDHQLDEKIYRLRQLIRSNFWFREEDEIPDAIYHEVLYQKGREAQKCRDRRFWLPFFSPQGYGYRFDALANVFVSLLGVASEHQRGIVDDYIAEEVINDEFMMLPAFYPVITPADGDWQGLQMMFSHSFKNRPHEYHNGGMWAMITGFRVADLALRGQRELAERYLEGIDRANRLPVGDSKAEWGFPEYVHGSTFKGEGTPKQGWSAAAAVIGTWALAGRPVFEIE